jgi:hypothetical protein
MKPKTPRTKYMPWKDFIVEVICWAPRSLAGVFLPICWIVCGVELGHYLNLYWGKLGLICGFIGGFIISSAITWLLLGRREVDSKNTDSDNKEK